MGDKTGIGWTDASWNPTTGCRKVSAGCKYCYAEVVADRFWPTQYPPIEFEVVTPDGEQNATRPRVFIDVQCHPERLDQPLRWTRPRRIFVDSMSDLFQQAVPTAFVVDVFDVIFKARQHQFQILTKRAERMAQFCKGVSPLPHVWMGVSIEDDSTAPERLAHLMAIHAAGWKTFVSFEPLIGPITVGIPWVAIDWVIVGGETGRLRREMPMDGFGGAKELVLSARSFGIPVFVKQDSAPTPGHQGRWSDELWALKQIPERS